MAQCLFAISIFIDFTIPSTVVKHTHMFLTMFTQIIIIPMRFSMRLLPLLSKY